MLIESKSIINNINIIKRHFPENKHDRAEFLMLKIYCFNFPFNFVEKHLIICFTSFLNENFLQLKNICFSNI